MLETLMVKSCHVVFSGRVKLDRNNEFELAKIYRVIPPLSAIPLMYVGSCNDRDDLSLIDALTPVESKFTDEVNIVELTVRHSVFGDTVYAKVLGDISKINLKYIIPQVHQTEEGAIAKVVRYIEAKKDVTREPVTVDSVGTEVVCSQ